MKYKENVRGVYPESYIRMVDGLEVVFVDRDGVNYGEALIRTPDIDASKTAWEQAWEHILAEGGA